MQREGDKSEELCFQQRGLWVFVRFLDQLSFFVGAKSMGAQLSKTAGKAETVAEKPGEAAASPTKTNGQVNDILTASSSHPSGENLVVLQEAAL